MHDETDQAARIGLLHYMLELVRSAAQTLHLTQPPNKYICVYLGAPASPTLGPRASQMDNSYASLGKTCAGAQAKCKMLQLSAASKTAFEEYCIPSNPISIQKMFWRAGRTPNGSTLPQCVNFPPPTVPKP